MEKLATLISWLFLPLFTPIYGLILVLYLPVQSTFFDANASLYLLHPTLKILFILLFSVFIVLAPGLSLVVMKRNKTISSLELGERKERFGPIGLMTFYCMILFLFLHFQGKDAFIPPILKGVVLGGAMASLIAYFITKKIKISLHSIGMGSLFGFIYMFSLPLERAPVLILVAILILSGIVGSARLYLKAHTLKEIGLGFALGFVSQLICLYIYLKFIPL